MNTNLLIALLLGCDFNEEGCSLRSKNLKVKLKKYEDYKMFNYDKDTLQVMLELEKTQDVVFEFRKINSHYQMIKIHNLYYSNRDVSHIVGKSFSEMF